MSKLLQCKSCGGTYPDTRDSSAPAYFHVCPDEILVTPGETDDKGRVITAAVYKPMPNPRNENFRRNPDKPGEYVMISEGAGFTVLE